MAKSPLLFPQGVMILGIYGIVETLCGWVVWPNLIVMDLIWIISLRVMMIVELVDTLIRD